MSYSVVPRSEGDPLARTIQSSSRSDSPPWIGSRKWSRWGTRSHHIRTLSLGEPRYREWWCHCHDSIFLGTETGFEVVLPLPEITMEKWKERIRMFVCCNTKEDNIYRKLYYSFMSTSTLVLDIYLPLIQWSCAECRGRFMSNIHYVRRKIIHSS